MSPPTTIALRTPPGGGAISMLELRGGDVRHLLEVATGRRAWPLGRARLADFAGADEGIAIRVQKDVAWLMGHGGTAVPRAIVDAFVHLGAVPEHPAERSSWPEAADPLEAAMLELVARAPSLRAISLLAEQPDRWRSGAAAHWTPEDVARSARLDRLLRPPTVVLAGPPNIGKSTLANALAGRVVAVAADEPGTTRDTPSVDLHLDGLTVTWHDAPGLRPTADPLERAAIDRAASLLTAADLLVAAADASRDWPDLPRPADLRIALRPDLGRRADADLTVGARDGTGLEDLAVAVRSRLVPDADLEHPRPWDALGRLRPVAGGQAQNPIDEMPQST